MCVCVRAYVYVSVCACVHMYMCLCVRACARMMCMLAGVNTKVINLLVEFTVGI